MNHRHRDGRQWQRYSNDGWLLEMCGSQNFESASAVLHIKSPPCTLRMLQFHTYKKLPDMRLYIKQSAD